MIRSRSRVRSSIKLAQLSEGLPSRSSRPLATNTARSTFAYAKLTTRSERTAGISQCANGDFALQVTLLHKMGRKRQPLRWLPVLFFILPNCTSAPTMDMRFGLQRDRQCERAKFQNPSPFFPGTHQALDPRPVARRRSFFSLAKPADVPYGVGVMTDRARVNLSRCPRQVFSCCSSASINIAVKTVVSWQSSKISRVFSFIASLLSEMAKQTLNCDSEYHRG